jgi:hypothetical protein
MIAWTTSTARSTPSAWRKRASTSERFDKIDERFDGADERFAKGLERIEERLDTRLIKLYQTMIWFCGIVLAALIGVIAS